PGRVHPDHDEAIVRAILHDRRRQLHRFARPVDAIYWQTFRAWVITEGRPKPAWEDVMIRTLFAFVILSLAATPVFGQPAKPTLDSRWAELTTTDDGKAMRALLALATTPKETTGF